MSKDLRPGICIIYMVTLYIEVHLTNIIYIGKLNISQQCNIKIRYSLTFVTPNTPSNNAIQTIIA